MRVIVILAIGIVTACAVGSQDTYDAGVSTQHKAPHTSPPVDDNDAGIQESNCSSVTTVIDSCNYVQVSCNGVLVETNIYCPPNNSPPSWGWIPDPPPPWSSK